MHIYNKKPVKLIIDTSAIHPPLTGIGHYALRLVRGLRRHPVIRDLRYFRGRHPVANPEITLAKTPIIAVEKPAITKIPQLHQVAALLHDLLQQNLFRWRTRHLDNHLFYTPNYILPPWSGPSVATLHDLSHIHYPQHHPKERIHYLERHLPRTLNQASQIITVSEFVRQDIHQHLGVPLSRITTIYNGVDKAFQPNLTPFPNPILAQYGLTSGAYLLSVCTLEPRKNLARLAAAWQMLPAALRQRWPLILVGTPGWLTKEIEQRLEPLERAGHARRLGYVPQEHLPILYAGAYAFVYPSLYEGFGLPVLEAMASGVPVLTSNCSSLPEVAGNAALLVEPNDIDTIAVGLEQLLSDDIWRETAIKQGLAQAQHFSWERCIEETIAVYQKVLAS